MSPDPPLYTGDRPGHVSVPQLDDRSSEPVVKTRIRAPYSVVFPVQLRFLCVTERPVPLEDFSPSASDVYPAIHRWHGVRGTITPALRSGLQCLAGTPNPFSGWRRTIFCTGPIMRLCVASS